MRDESKLVIVVDLEKAAGGFTPSWQTTPNAKTPRAPKPPAAPKASKAPAMPKKDMMVGMRGKAGTVAQKVTVKGKRGSYTSTRYKRSAPEQKKGRPVRGAKATTTPVRSARPKNVKAAPLPKAPKSVGRSAHVGPPLKSIQSFSIGDTINHNIHGDGKVISKDRGYLKVAFGNKTKTFDPNELIKNKAVRITKKVPQMKLKPRKEAKGKILGEPAAKKPTVDLGHHGQHVNDVLERMGVTSRVEDTNKGPIATSYHFKLKSDADVDNFHSGALKSYLENRTNKSVIVFNDKGNITVQVTNPGSEDVKNRTVAYNDVVSTPEYKNRGATEFYLGHEAASGKPVKFDLAKMPHGYIAGGTGGGKSEIVRSILTSLIDGSDPDDLKITVIDPKGEYSDFDDAPHLTGPRITEPKEAIRYLNRIVGEMDSRFSKMEKLRQELQKSDPTADVKGLEDYNKYAKQKIPRQFLLMDEFQALQDSLPSNSAKAAFQEKVRLLTAKARAAGIHILLSTQSPRSDILNGKVKANLGFVISTKVKSKTEEGVVGIDGATGLLGKGDAMMMDPATGDTTRFQSMYATTANVVDAVKRAKERFAKTHSMDPTAAGVPDVQAHLKDIGFDGLSDADPVLHEYAADKAFADKYLDPSSPNTESMHRNISNQIQDAADFGGNLTIALDSEQTLGQKLHGNNSLTETAAGKLAAYRARARELGFEIQNLTLSPSGRLASGKMVPVKYDITKIHPTVYNSIAANNSESWKPPLDSNTRKPVVVRQAHPFMQSGQPMKYKPPGAKEEVKGYGLRLGSQLWLKTKNAIHRIFGGDNVEMRKSVFGGEMLVAARGSDLLYFYDDGSVLRRGENGLYVTANLFGHGSFAKDSIPAGLMEKSLDGFAPLSVWSKSALSEKIARRALSPKTRAMLMRTKVEVAPCTVMSATASI